MRVSSVITAPPRTARKNAEVGVMRAGGERHFVQLGEGDDDHPGHQVPGDQVRGQGDDPEPQQRQHRPRSGHHGGHRDEEVLGEQLRPGEQQPDEPDRERHRGQQFVPGLVLDDEIDQHADGDVHPAEEAGGDETQQRTGEPVAPLVHHAVVGVLDLGLISCTLRRLEAACVPGLLRHRLPPRFRPRVGRRPRRPPPGTRRPPRDVAGPPG
jgi:hypothetical protein